MSLMVIVACTNTTTGNNECKCWNCFTKRKTTKFVNPRPVPGLLTSPCKNELSKQNTTEN